MERRPDGGLRPPWQGRRAPAAAHILAAHLRRTSSPHIFAANRAANPFSAYGPVGPAAPLRYHRNFKRSFKRSMTTRETSHHVDFTS
ncbi:hypothetical protein [Castellaniella defragrans]|jgi:hypothetical protein|uniref:hypothetical protein n=1 Tax=Castellaniella defragrans TaxID=75697 RepID=UPI0023F34117|nr:hypothetical protein [Castellaniella defragrans]